MTAPDTAAANDDDAVTEYAPCGREDDHEPHQTAKHEGAYQPGDVSPRIVWQKVCPGVPAILPTPLEEGGTDAAES
jgi:hypothetical protein